MIRWMEGLYLGEGVEKRYKRIREDMERGKLRWHVYVLMLSTNPQNQLDILSSAFLRQPFYRNQDLTVVGLASGYQEALTVLQRMAADAVRATGKADLRAFLAARCPGEQEGKDG